MAHASTGAVPDGDPLRRTRRSIGEGVDRNPRGSRRAGADLPLMVVLPPGAGAVTARDRILGRIREALRAGPSHHAAPTGPVDFREAMPPGGISHEESLALFARHAQQLRADFQCVETWGVLASIARTEGWRRVATHAGKLTDEAVGGLGLEVLHTDRGYDRTQLESCDAGISECEVLVAQTGGVMVSAASSGGRGLSVLPPHHVVLATSAQLVPDLTAAFAHIRQRYGDRPPSFISFITGPSRTGDIERILVLGAHGPKKLTILMRHSLTGVSSA